MIAFRSMHPELRPYAEYAHEIARTYGLNPEVTSVTRSWTDQSKLRANYEACVARGLFPGGASLGPGLSCRYPANRPGDSAHNYGVAWDSWVPAQEMPLWVAIRRYVGWAVPDNDQIHAELPNWRTYLT